jgi:hypothetical protein
MGMRLEKGEFGRLKDRMLAQREWQGKLAYSPNARLFLAETGSKYPPIYEKVRGIHNGLYIVYASINGVSHVVDHGILRSIAQSNGEEIHRNDTAASPSICALFGTDFEVVAQELPAIGEFGKHPKWLIWMLHDQATDTGYKQEHITVAGAGWHA